MKMTPALYYKFHVLNEIKEEISHVILIRNLTKIRNRLFLKPEKPAGAVKKVIMAKNVFQI